MKRMQCVAVVGAIALAEVSLAQTAGEQLKALLDERIAWQMEEFPEYAMSKGDYTHADRISDNSLEAIERRQRETVNLLNRLRLIETAKLNDAEQLNYDLFEQTLVMSTSGHRFKSFQMPVGGRSGPQQDIPQMAERVRFSSLDDYEDYLSRLEQTPKWIDDTIALMRAGVKEGRTPPKAVLAGVPDQFMQLLESDDGLADLAKPFNRMPSQIGKEQAAALRKRFDSVSLPAVKAGIAKLARYFNEDYLPHCRTDIAATSLPDGEAYYAHQLHVLTTTDLTPKQIHELGLAEVKRIRSEMMNVIVSSDFPKTGPDGKPLYKTDDELFKAFIEYLRTNPRFYCKTPEELLMRYRDICKRVDAGLPKLFKTLPRLPYGVREIPLFMAPTQTTAYYQQGDIRNAEPGYFYANTYALEQRPTYEMIALAMHEAVPGHHLQIALSQELPDQHEFRQELYYNAFGEGWALYSERLGLEMGLYEDPYDNFGRLLYEMWRATRLVVDPGMHALGWSRQQAIDFMLANTALSELNIINEVDRYISWPGQACGYKLGELKIRELRAKAEQTLGTAFDIREFHDVVLGAGALPLNLLEKRVNEWMLQAPKRVQYD